MKSQVEITFELLVAVIIMGFVLIVGAIALHELERAKCAGEIEDLMEKIKSGFEDLWRGKVSFDLVIKFECGRNAKLYFDKEVSSVRCEAICKTPIYACNILSFESENVYVPAKCVFISIATIFSNENDEDCPTREGFKIITFVEDPRTKKRIMPPGFYNFSIVNRETIPKICVAKPIS